MLNISLPDQMQSFLEEQAKASGVSSLDEYIYQLVLQEQTRIDQKQTKASLIEAGNNQETLETKEGGKISLDHVTYDPNAIPIWELVAQLSATVPDEEWAKLPTDLARNFDHYQQ